jgi:hypothetical protein
MVSCRYLRNVKQQIDMLISLRYLQDNWFYLGGVSFCEGNPSEDFQLDIHVTGPCRIPADPYGEMQHIRL